jgi:hypothetical protein
MAAALKTMGQGDLPMGSGRQFRQSHAALDTAPAQIALTLFIPS